jgi:hypothetical protein
MTAGHFGFAAGVKSKETRVPLWGLMFSTYLLDFIFIALVGAGVESFAPLDPAHPGYGQVLIHAYYTHSLVGAALISLAAGWIASRAWGRRAGVVIGAVAFSHWILDLVVQRPDMPILPGNLGGLPLLGFGLWQFPAISAVVELALTLGGAYLYYRSARSKPSPSGAQNGGQSRALAATGITGLLMVLLLAADVFNLPVYVVLLLILLLVIFCGWLDSRLKWPIPAA